MRIIKNNSLTSIAISFDGCVLAYGDGNKNITLVDNKRLIEYYKSQKSQKESTNKFLIVPADPNLAKIDLNYQGDSINALVFAKSYSYNLISASSDKSIIIWYLSPDLTQNKKRLLTLNSEVTDLQLSLNDQLLFASCMDNNIYIYCTRFQENGNADLISTMSFHNNIITSLALDNSCNDFNANRVNFRCASYADDGRLIVTETNTEKGIRNSVYKDYKEFINTKNKINSIQKKIDWSCDGNWIASVNYHYIKNHKIYHLKLVDLRKPDPQILFGHESAILVAKFSYCIYTDKNGKNFNILATGDKSGNLILWKICESSFKVLAEINNISESNITNLCWSPFGDFLYISNSNGSIYIVELNEFTNNIQPSNYHMEISKLMTKTIPQAIPNIVNMGNNYFQNPNNLINNNNPKDQLKIIFSPNGNQGKSLPESNINSGMEIPMEAKKRKINPIMLDDKKNGNMGSYPINYANSNGGNNMMFGNYMNDVNMQNKIQDNGFMNQFIGGDRHIHENDNCNVCKILRFDSIQTKEVNIKLDLADDFAASFVWENKMNSYSSYIKLIINNKILFYNHLNGKFIKHFVCNNFVYVYYDTNNLIHISSLLNTNILNNLHYDDVSYIRLFGNFVLIVSAGNKFTIVNAFTKRKILDEYIDVKLDSHSTISDVKYFDIDKIFVFLSQFNQIKKTFVKQIFLFNTEFKQLMKVDENQELENMINTKIIENNKIKSIYSDILSQNNLTQSFFENLMSIDYTEEELAQKIKLTDEIKEYEERLSFARLLGQKDDFFKILRNYMIFLVKYKINYKIIDLTMDILRLNSEFYFYIKDDTDILIANLLREIFVEDQSVNIEIKNYVICLAQEN